MNKLISKYGTYGTGVLTEPEFMSLYLDTVVTALEGAKVFRGKELSEAVISGVWNDLINHDIPSPAEAQRSLLEEKMREKYGDGVVPQTSSISNLMDECEIIEMSEMDHTNSGYGSEDDYKSETKSSYEKVELALDGTTPKRIRDGDFVFIDEESCIGCSMCPQIAPSSFVMLENGRARSFSQSSFPEVKSAIDACPVDCMHQVAFHELKEFESARDHGDGRTDHRHMTSHTPLNVAGIDSDANHKSSWYHYLKHKCHVSSSCPQRGCYDCPMFSSPGANPNFKERHRQAERSRAQTFVATGEADIWRKTTEL